MTTFQDKQPQSRRALRQEERAERPETDGTDTPNDAETAGVSGRPTGRRARSNFADGLIEVSGADSGAGTPLILPLATDSAVTSAAETTNNTSEASESTNSIAETTPAWAGPSFGFRSAGFDGSSIPPLAEPDDAEQLDETPLEEIMAAAPADDSSVARAFPFAAQVEATSDDDGNQTFQISDFPPEAAGSANSAVPAGEPTPVVEPVVPVETVVDEPVVVESAVVEPAVVAPDESTMTRREWRAWRAQQEAAAGSADASAEQAAPADTTPEQPSSSTTSATPVFTAPASAVEPALAPTDPPQLVEPQAEPAAALSDAMAEFEALTRGGQTNSRSQKAPGAPTSGSPSDSGSAEASNDVPDPIVPAFPRQPASAASATSVPSIFSVPTFTAPVPPEVPVPSQAERSDAPAQPAAVPATPARDERSGQPTAADLGSAKPVVADAPEALAFKTPASEAPASETPASEAPAAEESAYVPPVGHWSRQAALDDESQPLENTLSRDVGGGNVATTTNALVLPMIPQRDDFSSMINSTGEIMVTGTIDLPMSVGATGRDSRHYDDPEVDHLFDAFDNEVATTDSAPVRAITAVSSHTATRSGIESTRKQGNRMLTVLIVTACVMAVGVVGLLVAGFVFDIFQA